MFFNEQEIIDIDEMVTQESSFKNIMNDGIVTDNELYNQAQRVIELLHEAECRFNKEDVQFIKKLLAESCVLSEIYHYYSLQSIR